MVGKSGLALFVILCFVCCSHSDIWYQLRQKKFEIVEEGTYRGTLKYMPQPGKYEKLVSRYRKEIEKNLDLLPVMTRQYFQTREELIYQYKFTWLDEEENILVLRYFAHVYNDPIYAGYQILFAYRIATNRLLRILVSEVPLE